jgi:outer membrane protein insertion porin family
MKLFLLNFSLRVLIGLSIGLSISLTPISSVNAQEVYQIDDIQVLGLQRISAATVFASIDVKANSEVSDVQLQKAIRDLFATGFFDDVTIGQDNKVLIIKVKERPVISRIVLEGNKIIENEPLLEGLKSIGLFEGEVFKQSALEAISKQLNFQYGALGRYSAEIKTLTKLQGNNQIIVGIRINEGRVAKIKHINIVGNKAFEEEKLQGLFELNKTGTWSWITGNDKYARELLSADLEKLTSYYLDRGYLNFRVKSTQVSLSPDKETVFITVNLSEGKKLYIGEIIIAGEPILPEKDIRALISISEGDVFSQLLVTQSESVVQRALGNEGYSSASISGIPEVVEMSLRANVDIDQEAIAMAGPDAADEKIRLTFFIRPGSISYVRRITFAGNTASSDDVLRREMRQLEGAPVSTQKLEQSKTRLERLGLFGNVALETRDVPGTIDQVDIEFTVTEQPTANINLSLGFSGDNGVNIGAGLQHNNWLGSGKTFGFDVQTGRSSTTYNVNYRDPYFTPDGVSRGVRLFYSKRDFDEISVSNYATDTVGLNVNFGYPISDTSRLSFGVGVQNISIEAGTTTAQEIKGTPFLRSGVDDAYVSNDFFDQVIVPTLGNVGNTAAENIEIADTNNNDVLDEFDILNGVTSVELDDLRINPADGTRLSPTLAPAVASGYQTFNPSTSPVVRDSADGFLDKYGDSFNTLTFDLGWSKSTLNRGSFPTKGSSQRFNAEIATPGGDLEFYKLTYRNDIYFPISNKTAFHIRGRVGYADDYGSVGELPFFENFLSGGIGSVRGFENSSLGPKGTPANAYVAVPVSIDGTAAGSVNSSNLDYVYVLDRTDGQLLTANIDDDPNTLGGNILAELSAELILPVPFVEDNDKARLSLFVDSGNVFSTQCSSTQANCDDINLANMSVSAGIGIEWLSPIGPLGFNLSSAIKEQPFDKTESFQFSLGRSF